MAGRLFRPAFLSFFVSILLALVCVFGPLKAEASPRSCAELLRFPPLANLRPELYTIHFGPEFTFTNAKLIRAGQKLNTPDSKESRRKFSALQNLLKSKCSKRACRFIEGSDKHGPTVQVFYPDGWHFTLSLDKNVIEVQTKPGTYHEFLQHRERIQTDIFDFLKAQNLTPHERLGGGHIHIDAGIFRREPMLFRNFMLDYFDHPELGYGIFGAHMGNSPTYAMLPESSKLLFAEKLAEFDSLEESRRTFERFSEVIRSSLYREHPFPSMNRGAYASAPGHYTSVKINYVFNTLEFRGYRPQESAATFVAEIELILLRLNHLSQFTDPVPFRNPSRSMFEHQQLVNGFHDYVLEMGHEHWSRFRNLLPPHLEGLSPDASGIPRGYTH